MFGTSYWQQRKYPQAIQEFATYGQQGNDKNYADFAAALDAGYRSGGWPVAAHKGIEALLTLRKSGVRFSSSYLIAALYASVGEKDQAFLWLNTALEEHDAFVRRLPVDTNFDALRSDPRYKEFVRKMGFPQ